MSFKENFERGSKEQLDYDDSAFYYFSTAMLSAVLIPITYTQIIKPIFTGGDIAINRSLRRCPCEDCDERLEKRSSVYKYYYLNKTFMIKFAFLGFLWFLNFYCFYAVKDIEPLKSFVPHEILGVDTSASVREVKKAYRKLSREKHPDKNPDNPEAVNEFIQITKAYTIMTDETARENFLKFGNPDGKGSFAVGIALPNFLQKKDFQIQVLLVFFVVVIIIIPSIFLNRIAEGQKDVGGTDLSNRQVFAHLINEQMTGKHIPAIIAHATELRTMKVKDKAEFGVLTKYKSMDKIKEAIPKQTKDPRFQLQVKPICLIMAYMNDLWDQKDLDKCPTIKADLENVLRMLPSFLDIMLEVTMELAQAAKRNTPGVPKKRLTAKNVMTLIQFSQNMVQGGWKEKDPFYQLPYLNKENLGKFHHRFNKTLYQYTRLERLDRVAIMKSVLGDTPEDMKKIVIQEACIHHMPIVKLTMTAFVQGEDEVVVGDVLTCKLRIDYLNFEDGEKSGYVHSKHYPFLKRDSWYLIITDETFTNLATVEKIVTTKNFYEKEFKERISRPGKISFTAVLSNDSYKGLDQVAKVEVNVVQEPTNRVTYEYSKADLKAVKEGSMLQQMINEEDETDSDEENLAEEEELMKKLQQAGLEEAAAVKKAK